MALQHRSHLLHHLQIQAEEGVEPGTLDFQHHLTATAKAGPMHLCEGRGSQRHRIEINHLSATGAELLLQHGLHLFKRESGHAVLQGCKLCHPTGGKDVGSR